MKMNIDIDEALLLKAKALSKLETTNEVVERALRALTQFEDPKKVIDLLEKDKLSRTAFK